jgi:hypothetical protein
MPRRDVTPARRIAGGSGAVTRNLRSRIRRSRRAGSAMAAFDRLPRPLRLWLAAALLPWSPHSAARAYRRALLEEGDIEAALGRLSAIEARQVARDAAAIWGSAHPAAAMAARSASATGRRPRHGHTLL